MTIDAKLERTVLALVRAGAGRATWHSLATHLPSYDVPLDPDVMTVLKELQARGLVSRRQVPGKMDAWAITPAGEAALGLSPDELADFAAALRGDATTSTAALLPYVDDGLKLWAVLRQVLASDESAAEPVAAAGLFLPRGERGPFARELLDDPRPAVRAALFRAWTPARTDVPGDPLPTVPDAELDELLRRGLTDPSREVREAAAALAFLAGRGAGLAGELTINLGAPEPALRWWSILALGGARDPLTRALLEETAAGADLADAAAAIRALGARPDGREAWLAGLRDPRPDVRDAALFALRTVVTGLDDATLAILAADLRPELQQALAAYRARVRPVS